MQGHKGGWAFQVDAVNNWAYWDEALSKEECDQLIKIGEGKIVEKAVLQDKLLNDQIRDSEVSWLYPNDATWLFERITTLAESLNERFFKLNLFGIIEGIQFTKYTAPSGFYGMHMDKVFNGAPRKLSIVIQLSDEKEYDGGELMLHTSCEPEVMGKTQGKLIAFPSYIMHEVKPITKGKRYSLVIWISGEQFK